MKGLLVCVSAAALALAVGLAAHPAAGGQPDPAEAELVARGRSLYLTGCSTCHGLDARGQVLYGRQVPALVDSGAAAAYYYLNTGRMPLANLDAQVDRKPPAYAPDEIRALVAYVGSLGDGPSVPPVAPESADLAFGGVLYRENCAPCHAAGLVGGALSYGRAAPTLSPSEPRVIASAVRVGPGQMPVFGPDVVGDAELDAIVAYVQFLQDPPARGGLPLGRAGPIPEGFVVWVFGIGAFVLAAVWIARRRSSP
ncbi:MAG: c-type cytochrome [Acidimicrobiales bacterium]